MLTSSTRLRRESTTDDGFTLIELIISVALMLVITVSLTGIVISYLKNTTSTQGRLTESHDVQFASAYWQRDVASIGVRSTTYCQYATDPGCYADHSFPLQQSVNVSPACAMPAGATALVTLAWSQYDVTDVAHPKTVTVSYLTKSFVQNGKTRKKLLRVRCTGAVQNGATLTLADNLTGIPTITCTAAVAGCTGAGNNVPTVIKMQLAANDPDSNNSVDYSATLTGERRTT